MRIKYLGTCASEGFPALFCECEVCKKARINGDKDIRSRTQALINDDLLIDYPADSYSHFLKHNIDLTKIRNLIVTHSHEDHFYPLDFTCFSSHASHPKIDLPFCIHGNKEIFKLIKKVLDNWKTQGLVFNYLKPFKTYSIGKYKVTPIKANHTTKHPYLYIISDGVKTIFYCHDSGLLFESDYKFIKKNNFHFDLISLDCTEGNKPLKYFGHMNLERNHELIKRLKEIGAIDDSTKIVLSHFSHNGYGVLYEEMCKLVKDDGFIISYDGLEIEI